MRVLTTGAGGQVGRELRGTAWPEAMDPVLLTRSELDITDARAVAACLAEFAPDVVVNAAAYTAVDRAEEERERAFAVNRDGPANLAVSCAKGGAVLVQLSTDYVFDGGQNSPYGEDDPVNPGNVYGASKEAGERAVRERLERHLILRSSWIFSAQGANFVKTMLRLGAERDQVAVVADQIGCPTAAAHLAEAIVAILATLPQDGTEAWGTYHLCGAPPTSWYGFAEEIFALAASHGARPPRLRPVSSQDYPTPAPRPGNSVLDCSRVRVKFGIVSPPWRDGLAGVIADLYGKQPPRETP